MLALIDMKPRPRCGRAFPLPRGGEGLQRGNVKVAIVRTFLVQRPPNLLRDRRGEHVQDLVAVVARLEQPCRRCPHLRRVVVPQLRGHDLVHREMQAGIDRLAFNLNISATFSQRAVEFRVLVTNHERAHVGISQISDRQIKLRKRSGLGDEPESCVSLASG